MSVARTTERQGDPAISFQARLVNVGSWTLLRLPEDASLRLPSRGQAMVEGTIDGFRFLAPLEPDGQGGHWLKVDEATREAIGAVVGGTVALTVEPVERWPEPTVPEDLEQALATDPDAHREWMEVTPMARWDWIRWIGATPQPETRRRRIEVACSKLNAGKRRPCCFDRSRCADPSVSKNGVLLDPKSS